MGDHYGAYADLDTIVFLDSTYWKAYDLMGALRTKVRQFDLGCFYWQKAIEINNWELECNPKAVNVLMRLTALYTLVGDKKKAKEMADRFVAEATDERMHKNYEIERDIFLSIEPNDYARNTWGWYLKGE